MKVAQLTAAGIVMDVIEGKNLNKVFQKHLQHVGVWKSYCLTFEDINYFLVRIKIFN